MHANLAQSKKFKCPHTCMDLKPTISFSFVTKYIYKNKKIKIKTALLIFCKNGCQSGLEIYYLLVLQKFTREGRGRETRLKSSLVTSAVGPNFEHGLQSKVGSHTLHAVTLIKSAIGQPWWEKELSSSWAETGFTTDCGYQEHAYCKLLKTLLK